MPGTYRCSTPGCGQNATLRINPKYVETLCWKECARNGEREVTNRFREELEKTIKNKKQLERLSTQVMEKTNQILCSMNERADRKKKLSLIDRESAEAKLKELTAQRMFSKAMKDNKSNKEHNSKTAKCHYFHLIANAKNLDLVPLAARMLVLDVFEKDRKDEANKKGKEAWARTDPDAEEKKKRKRRQTNERRQKNERVASRQMAEYELAKKTKSEEESKVVWSEEEWERLSAKADALMVHLKW